MLIDGPGPVSPFRFGGIGPALALGIALAGLLPLAASAQGSGQRQEGLEIVLSVRDQAPRCDPGELRLPSQASLDLRIRNGGTKSVVIRGPDWLTKANVKNAEVEAGGAGYVVAGGESAQLVLEASGAGRYRLTCGEPGANAEAQTVTVTVAR